MDYEQSLEYVASLKSFNGAPTLDRMKRLMALLGNPQETLKIIHVAGTNGKGSTSAMIASILRAAGVKTGLTVSPYIVDFCERIQINGEMIPRDLLAREVSHIKNAADIIGGVTQFEVITAAAYAYFARESCGVVVAEVGLGGRFDATNVIEHPLVSVITSIGLDHTAILGDTLELIAPEKCGIIKHGSPVVCAPEQHPAALGVIRAAARERGCALIEPSAGDIAQLSMSLSGSEFCYRGLRIRLPLIGRHQTLNALTAIEAAAEVLRRGFALPLGADVSLPLGADVALPLGADVSLPLVATSGDVAEVIAITRGLAQVKFPARLELMCPHPPVLLDGAHNPDGMLALAQALELLGGRPVTAVMGMLTDKDVETSVEIIASRCKRIFCVTLESPRTLTAEKLAEISERYCGEVEALVGVEAAIAAAVAAAGREGGAVVVCGSLYLAAQARPLMKFRKI